VPVINLLLSATLLLIVPVFLIPTLIFNTSNIMLTQIWTLMSRRRKLD
jgi:hypothetical protein